MNYVRTPHLETKSLFDDLSLDIEISPLIVDSVKDNVFLFEIQ